MEGCYRTHPFNFVNMTAGGRERLPKQSSAWSITQKQQSLRLGEGYVPSCKRRAGFQIVAGKAGTRAVEAGQARYVSLVAIEADCCKHALCEFPSRPRDGLSLGDILGRRHIGKEHHLGRFNSSWKSATSIGLCQRKRRRLTEPVSKSLETCRKVLGKLWSCERVGLDRRHSCSRAEPGARLLLYRNIDSRLDPPANNAGSLGRSQAVVLPTHDLIRPQH